MDIPVDPSEINEPFSLLITITDRLSKIVGQVLDSRGDIAANRMIVIQPAQRQGQVAYWRLLRVVRSNAAGQFEATLRPGHYLATAVESLEDGAQFSPEVQEQLRGSAREFIVRDGERVTVSLTMSSIYK